MKFKILLFFLFSLNLYSQSKMEYETVQIEGFYVFGFEASFFYEKKDEKFLKPIWLKFDKNFIWNDSLRKIFSENNLDGVYMEVKGRKYNNGNFGHLGSSKSMIILTEIVCIEPELTFSKYFDNKK